VVKINSVDEYNKYSVSRLKSYGTCSQLYKNKYVDKIKVEEGSYYTVLGSLVHKVLEDYYKGGRSTSLIELFSINAIEYLKDMGAPTDWDLAKGLISYTQGVQELYKKARPEYIASDSIRKADGSVASVPERTTGWKRQYGSLGLEGIKLSVNKLSQGFDIRSQDKDLCDVFAEAYNLLLNYKHPPIVHTVEHIEYPLSHLNMNTMEIINPVLMPDKYGGNSGIYLNGYIDLIGRDIEGKVVIIDHKTSSEEAKVDLIPYNVQLLAYAWAYEVITGETVSYIGISNIRAGTHSIAPVPSKEERDSLLKTLFNKHILIKNGVFFRHLPESNSPCLKMYGNPCPFLSTCWGDLANKLGY